MNQKRFEEIRSALARYFLQEPVEEKKASLLVLFCAEVDETALEVLMTISRATGVSVEELVDFVGQALKEMLERRKLKVRDAQD